MQITLNEEIVEKLRTIRDPEAFINAILKEKITDRDILKENMKKAADHLMDDYLKDEELTVFTNLDGEDIHAQE
jgi:hypothetical protein